ncbi:MAG TPA: HD domain-containing phosphohydrolase [Rhizobacter sp.]|nr:HD domain-containing phosphohydrolase [Rhizobacter sp.]
MRSPVQTPSFTTANPHALAVILEASETQAIVASHDIFDISGTKLWARDQPVSQALQRKLLDRQLRQPLESCLLAADGVNAHTLLDSLETLLGRDAPLSPLLRPHAAQLLREVQQLPLHSVAQLLLTAGRASRPETFEHAVQAMALNGALSLARGASAPELRVAMLSGLLHDLGEMYIAPEHGEADAERALDFQNYRHLVVHPHVGGLLLAQLTDYPAVISRAVAEHHERLDGSGYPHCLEREQISPQGRQLAVTEAVLGVLRGDSPQLARASVALRVVPGEFDLAWAGAVCAASRQQPPLQATTTREEMKWRLALLDASLQTAHVGIAALAAAAQSQSLMGALTLSQHLLERLRVGWAASGLWVGGEFALQDAAEIEAVEQELLFRLRSIHRAALLHAGKLPAGDLQSLNLLGEQLGG